MILVLCSPGHIVAAVMDALDALDESARQGDPFKDLFTQARGCRAIVYAPAARLLDGDVTGSSSASSDLMHEIIRVARSVDTVERIVVIEPSDASWEAEERALRRAGVAFTIIRCAPLVDELADATNLHTSRPVWLEHGGDVELASRGALSRAIRSALLWDVLRGATITVPAERMDIGEAMQRAAAVAGAAVKIHVAAPGVSLSMRKLYAWLGVASLEVEAVCDRLIKRSRPAVA